MTTPRMIHSDAPYEATARLGDAEWHRANCADLPPLTPASLQALRKAATSPRRQPIPAELETAEQAYLSLTRLRECQRRVTRLGRDVMDLPEAAIATLEAAIRGEPINLAQLAQARAEATELACRLRWIILKAHCSQPRTTDNALSTQTD
jgi:hypothetical protein